MRHRVFAFLCAGVALVVVSLSATPVAAQTTLRTEWGDPDLRGIWDFRTITPLQRPDDLADQ